MASKSARVFVLGALAVPCLGAVAAACGSSSSQETPAPEGGASDATVGEGGGGDAVSTASDATDSDATGNDAPGGDATGSDATGGDATAIDAGPGFLYVATDPSVAGGNFIYGYSWSASTGDLTPIDMDPTTPGIQGIPTPQYPASIVARPDGKFVYSVNLNDTSVSAFQPDPSTGVLTRVNASAADGGTLDLSLGLARPVLVVADPMGRCLYVADQGGLGSLRALTIDPSTGTVALARTVASADGADWIAVDTQARFLLVAGTGGQVAMHRLDPASGLPLAVDGGIGGGQSYPVPLNAAGVAVHPAGTSAYVSDQLGAHVLAYSVDPISLAMTALPTTDAGNYPVAALMNPNGGFLYTAGYASVLGVYAIADGGGLSMVLADAAVFSPGYPLGLDPTGEHLYQGAFPSGGGIGIMSVSGGSVAVQGRAMDAAAGWVPTRTFAWVRP